MLEMRIVAYKGVKVRIDRKGRKVKSLGSWKWSMSQLRCWLHGYMSVNTLIVHLRSLHFTVCRYSFLVKWKKKNKVIWTLGSEL